MRAAGPIMLGLALGWGIGVSSAIAAPADSRAAPAGAVPSVELPADLVQLDVVTTFAGGAGTVTVSLFASDDGYPRDASKAVHRVTVPMADGVARVTVPVNAGQWGVSAWLDEDGDGEMRTTWLGIPAEPLGVVGPKPTLLSPTSWERNTVVVGAEGATAEVGLFRI